MGVASGVNVGRGIGGCMKLSSALRYLLVGLLLRCCLRIVNAFGNGHLAHEDTT